MRTKPPFHRVHASYHQKENVDVLPNTAIRHACAASTVWAAPSSLWCMRALTKITIVKTEKSIKPLSANIKRPTMI